MVHCAAHFIFFSTQCHAFIARLLRNSLNANFFSTLIFTETHLFFVNQNLRPAWWVRWAAIKKRRTLKFLDSLPTCKAAADDSPRSSPYRRMSCFIRVTTVMVLLVIDRDYRDDADDDDDGERDSSRHSHCHWCYQRRART